ncbi:hypothetical protein M885DRAFT_499593 [Pelagophyceae sp. CCMP2097]|nr:hypothetical protein M885DRAFT_499593 [Pelagophyceae sp. CCMP2097]
MRWATDAVRTVRDPRDVIVSGYHHHLRCPRGEAWLFLAGLAYDALIVHPSTLAAVQSALPAGADVRRLSYCELLKALPKPVGLRAEIAVAAKHWLGALDSVRKLLDAAPGMQQSVLFVRYEDLWPPIQVSQNVGALQQLPLCFQKASSKKHRPRAKAKIQDPKPKARRNLNKADI